MKLYYGSTPIKSLNIHHFEMDTNDCTAISSDLQSGVTCVSKGKKVTGTGKAFEFAYYGNLRTNFSQIIPNNNVNVIHISCIDYPVKFNIQLGDMKDLDFSTEQNVGSIFVDNIEYPLTVTVINNMLTIACEQTLYVQVFYGRDNYV